MAKQAIVPAGGPPPGGAYSPGIKVGNMVFVAGQVGRDPATGQMVGGIEAQTARTLENVQLILEAAGATMADVVKATVHLSDMSLFARYNEVYARYFPDPKPVRTTVGSALGAGVMVEIDVIAVIEG